MTKLQPPGYLWIHLAIMTALHFALPVSRIIKSPYNHLGILPIAAGLLLNVWADQIFKRRQTTVKPFERSSALITDGPFRISRNPMYLGMLSALIGFAIVLGSLSAFFAPIVFCAIMNRLFIRHEEKAMEAVFGEDYLQYKDRVRSWL